MKFWNWGPTTILHNMTCGQKKFSSKITAPYYTVHTLWRPSNHLYTLSLYLLGRSVGEPGVVWGGGKQSSSISRFLGNSCALSTLKQIVHNSSFFKVFSILSSLILWLSRSFAVWQVLKKFHSYDQIPLLINILIQIQIWFSFCVNKFAFNCTHFLLQYTEPVSFYC